MNSINGKFFEEKKEPRKGEKVVAYCSIDDLKRRVLPLREQAKITDEWLKYRLENILPQLMEREQIDFWVVVAREYNEDPVVLSLMPAIMLSARRRTILVFHKKENGEVQCLSFGKPDPALNQFYSQAWDREKEEQLEALAREIRVRKPGNIGFNISDHFALGDGLSKSQYDQIIDALDSDNKKKIVSAEKLAVSWLEKRTPDELTAYRGINRIAHDIIGKAFSPEVIHPGVTTLRDLAWWIRQTINDIGLQAWFQPTIMIQREIGQEEISGESPILPGDLLHCDVGLHYLGLATDTQQMAYVLRPGEKKPPQELVRALENGNRLQDILTANFVEGKTGNEILLKSLDEAKEEGISASIYTHPIGVHGHGAGPTIGLFDQQSFIPFNGEYSLHNDTCYAIELNVKEKIAAWNNKEVMIALEQTAAFTGNRVEYLGGRQKEFHCI